MVSVARAAAVVVGVLVASSCVTSGTSSTDPGRGPRPGPTIPDDERAERIVASTDRVVAFGCGATSTGGTAIVLDDGRVVTNRHVVDGALLINVSPELGGTAVASARVSEHADLALLDEVSSAGRGLGVAGVGARPGDEIVIAGYASDDLGLTIAHTRVVDIVDGTHLGHRGEVLRLAGVSEVGTSGGPVVDASGALVGVAFAVQDPPGYTLAIPAGEVSALLGPDAVLRANDRCG